MVGGNGYVIQVKGNQRTLYENITEHVATHLADNVYITNEISRGRKENREVSIYNKLDSKKYTEWKGLSTLICVRNWGVRNNNVYEEKHYYISNRKDTEAQIYAKGIRDWLIENRLHWVKDKILYEDKSMVKSKAISGNLSLIRTIVMNIYRINKEGSIKMAIEKYSNRIQNCLNLIQLSHI